MSAGKRERSYGTYKISHHGNGRGVTIPQALDHEDFPNDLGDEVEVVLSENRSGEEELKLIPAQDDE